MREFSYKKEFKDCIKLVKIHLDTIDDNMPIRLLFLNSSLIIENYIDKYLSQFFKYDKNKNFEDYTKFSYKTKLNILYNLKIQNNLDINLKDLLEIFCFINELRNKFANNLEFENEANFKVKLENIYSKIDNFIINHKIVKKPSYEKKIVSKYRAYICFIIGIFLILISETKK